MFEVEAIWWDSRTSAVDNMSRLGLRRDFTCFCICHYDETEIVDMMGTKLESVRGRACDDRGGVSRTWNVAPPLVFALATATQYPPR